LEVLEDLPQAVPMIRASAKRKIPDRRLMGTIDTET